MTVDPALARRTARYRRSFGRGLRFNPDGYQRAIMDRCAKLSAIADLVLDDPTVSLNDRVRAVGAADRCHALMMKALEQRAKAAPNEFTAYLAEHKASA
jgi:hypothetical protein